MTQEADHAGGCGPRENCMGTDLLLAAFHEDVDVVAGLSEVDEVDDVGVLYLLADDHFRLDALDDIHLQFFA